MTATSRNYNRKHKPDPKWDDIYTLEEWLEAKNVYIDNDVGCGYWMKNDMICDKDEVFSSDPEDATHVMWYSK